jgi:hypothetical protein
MNVVTCPHCAAANPEYSKFCNQCGQQLTAAPTVVSPAAPHVLPMAQPASGKAVAALVLGILSLVLAGFFTGIPAMILGKLEKDEIAAGRAPVSGESLARIGFWLGLAGTVISGIVVIALIIFLLAMAGAVGSFGHWPHA